MSAVFTGSICILNKCLELQKKLSEDSGSCRGRKNMKNIEIDLNGGIFSVSYILFSSNVIHPYLYMQKLENN